MTRIAIIGPGAMGCLFGAYLKEGGLDVTLVDHLPDRAALLKEGGIHIEGTRGEHTVKVPVTLDAASIGPVDLVLVSVKACQTERALAQHRALVGDASLVWSVQNGLGNIEAMARVVPADRVIGGTTTLGANLLADGRVQHAGDGDTFMGELTGGASARIQALAQVLTQAGIQTQVSEDVRRLIWTKLLVNVGINALTALLGVRNGVLAKHEPTLAVMREAVAEAAVVAAEQGFSFDIAVIQARVEEVARLTAENRSSMLADVQAGKATEIDHINGAIADLGEAPVNRTLTRLIHALEATASERTTPG